MIRTYLDANALIAAYRGNDEAGQAAFDIIDDPQREFVGSTLLRMETLAHAKYSKRPEECKFYETFFQNTVGWATIDETLFAVAEAECIAHDVHADDAIHLAAAYSMGAQEFISGEKKTMPLYRTKLIKTVCIRP